MAAEGGPVVEEALEAEARDQGGGQFPRHKSRLTPTAATLAPGAVGGAFGGAASASAHVSRRARNPRGKKARLLPASAR